MSQWSFLYQLYVLDIYWHRVVLEVSLPAQINAPAPLMLEGMLLWD